LTDEEKQNFIEQVNNSEPEQFENVYRQAKKLISEKQGTGRGGEEDNSSDNSNSDNSDSDSESDSSSNSSNSTDNEDGNNNNQLPEKYQEITHFSLPQAKVRAEQEIEKLLKDNDISEQELDKKLISGENN
jgi:hypothetical protein